MALTADFIHSWNRNQLITFDLNPGLRVDTSRTGRINYTDLNGIAGQLGIAPFVNQLLTRTNDGSSRVRRVELLAREALQPPLGRPDLMRSRLRARQRRSRPDPPEHTTSCSAIRGSIMNYGPLNADRRHNFVVNGRYEVPKTGGLTVSGIYRYMTGDPDHSDQLGGGCRSERACCSTGCRRVTIAARARTPTAPISTGRRNGARGPAFRQSDLKFAYRLHPMKDDTIDVNVELFNLFNTANFSNPGAATAGFGSLTDQRLSDFHDADGA